MNISFVKLLRPLSRIYKPQKQYLSIMRDALKSSPRSTFIGTFERITDDLLKDFDPRVKLAQDRYRRVFYYNAIDGKLNRGMIVGDSLNELVPDCNEVQQELARVVGWCVELLQAYFLIEDDIEDSSVTRRGKPCWYKVDGIGMTAINDASFLRSMVYHILKRNLKGHPAKSDIMELFMDHELNTIIGQTMDMTPLAFEEFKNGMERVATVYEFKTAYYSFSLPVRCAMYLAGIDDPLSHKKAESILLKIGHLFQAQDDFLDCYGDPSITGKIGTDIQDNKCTWLAVTALQNCTSDQAKVMQENYGKNEDAAIQTVKAVYDDLDIPNKFKKYEEEEYKKLVAEIRDTTRTGLKPRVFENVVNKIYRRQK